MSKEFIDTSTARIALLNHSGLGCFEAHQKMDNPNQYSFVLYLDTYQSNCQRTWLEYRWRFRSLAGAQIVLDANQSLILSISRSFAQEELALSAFEAWTEDLKQEFDSGFVERS